MPKRTPRTQFPLRLSKTERNMLKVLANKARRSRAEYIRDELVQAWQRLKGEVK